MGTKYDVDE
jgi:WASH complex subunit 7